MLVVWQVVLAILGAAIANFRFREFLRRRLLGIL